MRRRVVRDLGTIAGIAIILMGVVGLNIWYRLDGLQKKYDQIRRSAESGRQKAGMELLDWDLLRKTKGSLRSGPTFDEALLARAKQGRTANLMGFMTPIDQFRDVTHFMLLPLPIECYFCQMPPMRDVMLVKMEEGYTVDIAAEAVLVSGNLNLHEGPKQKFFYSITNAKLQSGVKGEELHKKNVSEQHRTEGRAAGGKLLEDHGSTEAPQEQLLPGENSGAPAAPPAPK